MKHQSKSVVGICKGLVSASVMFCTLLMPVLSYAQSQAPPPPGPGNGGGNPDGVLGVPFDDNMNLAFLAIGVIFAVVLLKRAQKKQLAKNA